MQPVATITLKGSPHPFRTPEVMGILNVTPDSFYEHSRRQTERQIAERTEQIMAEGGTIIDVGGCSTRPGSEPVCEAEEMARLRRALPVVRRLHPEAVVSVDTFRPLVARMCVEEYGADIINDVSEGSPEMFRMVARLNVAYVLMSRQPTVEAIAEQFRASLAELNSLGCSDIILDPGYGFGKDVEQNYAVLRRQDELLGFGLPLLVGVSRKRMVWQLLGSSPAEAMNGTTAANAAALLHGARILRVHDVREAVETIKITEKCS